MAAVDYCPHCACRHVIGEHPRDGESRSQYWDRMRRQDADQREESQGCAHEWGDNNGSMYCIYCGEDGDG